MPVLTPAPLPTPLSRPRSPVVLLSGCMPAPTAVSCQAFMSPLLMLSLPLCLELSPLRTFKQSLSDKPWPRVSTSLSKPFYLFSALGALNPNNISGSYNPINKNKRKWGFNTAFINSRLLAGNHDEKELDLSFAGSGCPALVKLNRSWQLDLLDPKPVCIIKAIPLTAASFWDPFFAPCTRDTMKLAFKLGLKMNRIKNGMVKERIKAVWANKTVNLLDRLFKVNLE